MQVIQRFLIISTLATGLIWPLSSMAEVDNTHSNMSMASTSPLVTEGEIKKVNLELGKVTIKHGPIKHLDMPGMTMVFTAKDKTQLSDLKAGDKVQFLVVNEAGKMIVTDITALP